ncbi:MAG: DMT family transporter [Ekhidna sp.]|uniref:DMT family transporter n=1 Tax=Ekhidna sp. TaxID=2608089 RepID=UPI0032F0770D
MKLPIFQFSLSMLIAGTIGVFAMKSELTPERLVFFRCFFAAITMLIYCAYNRRRIQIPKISMELLYVIFGGLSLVSTWYCLFQAFELASITIGILCYFTAPFYVLILGSVLMRENVQVSMFAWLFLAFLGIIIAAANGIDVIDGADLYIGVVFGLLAGLFYAIATLFGKKIKFYPPEYISLLQMCIGALFFSFFIDFSLQSIELKSWVYVLILGIVHTAILYVLFYKSLKSIPIILIAPLMYIEPVIAIASDIIVYKSHFGIMKFLGIILVLLATFKISRENVRITQYPDKE